MPQIEKPDDLQSIANHPVFFVFHDGNNQKELGALIYQALHLAKALPFTDTLMKIDDLSVNLSEILDK